LCCRFYSAYKTRHSVETTVLNDVADLSGSGVTITAEECGGVGLWMHSLSMLL